MASLGLFPILLVFLFCHKPLPSWAQNNAALKPRVLVLLDGSSSMVENWDKTNKRYEEASRFILAFMDSLRNANPDVEFALRVFGHQYGVLENNCYDTKLEVRFSKDNFYQMGARLKDIKPYGVSPIAYSLQEAATYDLESLDKYYYSLVLITDGGESCGGDICDVVEKLISKKIFFKPYIVSLINYTPLSTQYACLGNMLTAADDKGFRESLHTLIDAHRTIIKSVKENPSLAQAPKKEEPKPIVAEKPLPPLPEKVVVAEMVGRFVTVRLPLQIAEYRKAKIHRATAQYPLVHAADFPEEIPARVAAPAMNKLNRFNKAILPTNHPKFATAKLRNTKVNYPLVRSADFPEELLPRAATPAIATLRSNRKINPIPTIYGTVNPKLKVVKGNFPLVKSSQFPEEKPVIVQTPKPPPPPEKKPEPKTQPKPQPKPPVVKKSVEKVKDAEFLKETEASTIEELYVYFSDGKGKYYKSEPQISLTFSETNAPAKTFYRTVNKATGEPDGQKLEPGVYNLLVMGRSNTYVRRLVIEKGKKTKLNIIVNNGSLKFEWEGNPNRAINEYAAIVNRRFAPDPDVRQNASEVRPYEPGTYYAEVNTYPVYKAAFDIGFDEQVTIRIPEPGEVQFMNSDIVGKVGLYLTLGDRFAQFGQVLVEGKPAEQILKIQPGTYQARYKKNPNLPLEQETIVTFKIQSNKRTEVTLPK